MLLSVKWRKMQNSREEKEKTIIGPPSKMLSQANDCFDIPYAAAPLYILLILKCYIIIFQRRMQSFSCEGHAFVPTDLSSYFLFPPNFWGQNLPFFSFNSAIPLQTHKEQSLFPALVQAFQAQAPKEGSVPSEQEFLTVENCNKVAKWKKVLSSEEEEGEEEQFKVKLGKTLSGASISYKKKNTESNIVNQTFSYLNCDRSKTVVSVYFRQDQKKVEEYYRLMAKVKQCSKKYINRKYLQRLLAFQSKTQFERAYNKSKLTLLTLDDVRLALRALMFNFLRAQSTQTLLTSCKIYKDTLPEHFWRKREILKYLFRKNSKVSN